MMRCLRFVVGAAVIAGSMLVPLRLQPVEAWTPSEAKPGSFSWVGACEDADQLDCIESIGAYIGGNLVAGQLTERYFDVGSTLVDGQWVKNERDRDWWGWYTREWSIPGLVNEDGSSLVHTKGRVVGPDTVDSRCNPRDAVPRCAPMMDLNVVASTLDGFKVPWESGSTNCFHKVTYEGDPYFGLCTREGHLQEGIKFRVVVRTSWLLPTVVVSKSDQTVVTSERLPQSGASRIAIEGIPYKTVGLGPGVDYANDPNSRASWNDRVIKLQLIDGRYWRSGTMYGRCADQPSIVVADNSWAPSTPSFDTSGGLQLNVSNSHYDTDGKTPFEGRYNGTIPLAMASCLWGDNLSSKSQFAAEVIESSTGEKKAATTAVSVNSLALRIDAYGFTFSSPTIRVKYIASASAVSPKKMTITCKKGKVVRKVTSLKPRCPVGFKKA